MRVRRLHINGATISTGPGVSNNDSFIDEVTDEVRRDRLFAMMRKYGWIGVVVVLAVVGGAAFNEWQKARTAAQSQAFGDAVIGALAANDSAARQAALGSIAATGARAAVLDMIASGEALGSGDKKTALARLAAVADDASLPDSQRQLATLKSVLIAGADMDAATRDATLAKLAQAGAPFRPLAMEQQALALVDADKTEDAVALFKLILQEPDVTQGLQSRVRQMMVALGAEPAA